MQPPSHLAQIQPFLAMEIMERAMAMEREGIDVVHLEVGEPDFPPPPAALAAAQAALSQNATNYTDSRGLHPLRVAIAEEKGARVGRVIDPEQVLVTSGTSPAMLMAFGVLLAPGDEILVPAPHYPCYPNFARFCGAQPVPVPCDPGNGWAIDPDAVRAAITPRTRAIVYGSPANPTGAVQPRDVVEALVNLGPPLLSDEIYDGLLYDGAEITSPLSLTDDAWAFDGFSKRYAMTGFRLGYVIAPTDAMRSLQTLQQNFFISASEFVQYAGLAALSDGANTVAAARELLEARRDRLVAGLRELGFEILTSPPGAFYVFADARGFGADSRELANHLLEHAHVGVTPGIDFGEFGEGFLRVSYAAPMESIEEALQRMAPVLEARLRA